MPALGLLFSWRYVDVEPATVYFCLSIGMTAGALRASQRDWSAGPSADDADLSAGGGAA